MSREQAESRPMERKHIFAVNRSVEFLDFLREFLQEEQFTVTTMTFLPTTCDQIAAAQPDLLIIDVALGHQAGWDLLERLQQEATTNQIPMIVTTTDPTLLDTAQEQQATFGGQHFLTKPFAVDELLDAIHQSVGRA